MTDDIWATDLMPDELSPPQQALWWLQKGGFAMGPDWVRAHVICQTREGERAYDLVHGLCHWIEGDMANRDYWYRQVEPWTRAATHAGEYQAMKAALAALT